MIEINLFRRIYGIYKNIFVDEAKNTESSKTLSKVMIITASVSLILFISLFLLYILTNGYLFSDFAETLSYCISRNPYSGVDNIHSIYQPFAFLPFCLFIYLH